MYTREMYTKKQVSHDEYFVFLADCCSIGNFNTKFLREVHTALRTDQHLNNISLYRWDSLALRNQQEHSRKLREVNNGECWSLAVGVCMLKAKARFEAIARFGPVTADFIQ